MTTFPIMVATDKPALLIGGGEVIWQKARTLLTRFAKLVVMVDDPQNIAPQFINEKIQIVRMVKNWQKIAGNYGLVVVEPGPTADELYALSQKHHFLLNIVDDEHRSNFYFASFVDKYPLTIAIGTENTAPSYATHLRAWLEAELPHNIDKLLQYAKNLRPQIHKNISNQPARRAFWRNFFAGPAITMADNNEWGAIDEWVNQAIKNPTETEPTLIFVQNMDINDLTLSEFRAIKRADCVIFEQPAPQIMALCRREAVILHEQYYGLDKCQLNGFTHIVIIGAGMPQQPHHSPIIGHHYG